MRLKAKQCRETLVVPVNSLISSDSEVRLIDKFVDKLDMLSHQFQYKTEKSGIDLGGPSEYDPKDLLRLYLYGYLHRLRSSRLLESACQQNVELIWLLSGQKPSHNTINSFRKDNLLSLYLCFQSFNRFWQELGLFGLPSLEEETAEILEQSGLPSSITYATDGSKFHGQNSKANNYNLKKIEANLARYDKKALSYLQDLEELDSSEDSLKKKGSKYEEILNKLVHIYEGKQKNLALKEQLLASGDSQVSLIDPDARRLTDNKGSLVGYNVQISVEESQKMIAHFQVVNTSDIKLFCQMGQPTLEFLKYSGSIPVNGLGDKGYCDAEQIYRCEQIGITTYIAHKTSINTQKLAAFRKDKFDYDPQTDTYQCPEGKLLKTNGRLYKKREGRFKEYRANTQSCLTCPFKEQCLSKSSLEKPIGRVITRTEFEDYKDANKQRVEKNKELYKKRKQIVEHPFGTIKRQWGYNYTLLKGLDKVTAEFALIFSVYNLRRAITELGINAIVKVLNKRKSLVFLSFLQKCLFQSLFKSVIG
jgi:transposase